MENNYVTIKIDEQLLEKIKEYYFEQIMETDIDYALFEIDGKSYKAICYQNKKGEISLVFNGESALREARRWDEEAQYNPKKIKIKYEYEYLKNQIGSDEVGNGDFLLPLIVVACRLSTSDVRKAMALGIKDSKKINDARIRALAPELVKFVKYSKLTLPNKKCSELIEKGENMNSIKAKMHNRALYNLHKEYCEEPIFIDQFCNEDKYYEYIEHEEKRVDYLNFACKGESLYPSVACASIIARYAFLLEKDKLEEQLKMEVPFGAGVEVDRWVAKFLTNHTLDELKEFCKQGFVNFKNIH